MRALCPAIGHIGEFWGATGGVPDCPPCRRYAGPKCSPATVLLERLGTLRHGCVQRWMSRMAIITSTAMIGASMPMGNAAAANGSGSTGIWSPPAVVGGSDDSESAKRGEPDAAVEQPGPF